MSIEYPDGVALNAASIRDRVITDDNVFDPPTPEETYRQLHAAHTKTHTS